MRRTLMNALTLLTVLIWISSFGASSAKAQQIVDAKLEATCTGYDGLQFTANGLVPNTSYTAVFTVTSVCPGSTTPATHNISVSFMTPMTITGQPGGAPYTSVDYIQVGNPGCVAGPNPNTFCENNPGLPTNTTTVQNYSSSFGINGPLSLNANDTSTNNGCKVNATATLTVNPSSVFVVNVEGHFAPDTESVVCPCLLTQLGPAGSFAILGLEDSRLQLSSGPLQVNGDVGIGADGLFQFSGGLT